MSTSSQPLLPRPPPPRSPAAAAAAASAGATSGKRRAPAPAAAAGAGASAVSAAAAAAAAASSSSLDAPAARRVHVSPASQQSGGADGEDEVRMESEHERLQRIQASLRAVTQDALRSHSGTGKKSKRPGASDDSAAALKTHVDEVNACAERASKRCPLRMAFVGVRGAGKSELVNRVVTQEVHRDVPLPSRAQADGVTLLVTKLVCDVPPLPQQQRQHQRQQQQQQHRAGGLAQGAPHGNVLRIEVRMSPDAVAERFAAIHGATRVVTEDRLARELTALGVGEGKACTPRDAPWAVHPADDEHELCALQGALSECVQSAEARLQVAATGGADGGVDVLMGDVMGACGNAVIRFPVLAALAVSHVVVHCRAPRSANVRSGISGVDAGAVRPVVLYDAPGWGDLDQSNASGRVARLKVQRVLDKCDVVVVVTSGVANEEDVRNVLAMGVFSGPRRTANIRNMPLLWNLFYGGKGGGEPNTEAAVAGWTKLLRDKVTHVACNEPEQFFPRCTSYERGFASGLLPPLCGAWNRADGQFSVQEHLVRIVRERVQERRMFSLWYALLLHTVALHGHFRESGAASGDQAMIEFATSTLRNSRLNEQEIVNDAVRADLRRMCMQRSVDEIVRDLQAYATAGTGRWLCNVDRKVNEALDSIATTLSERASATADGSAVSALAPASAAAAAAAAGRALKSPARAAAGRAPATAAASAVAAGALAAGAAARGASGAGAGVDVLASEAQVESAGDMYQRLFQGEGIADDAPSALLQLIQHIGVLRNRLRDQLIEVASSEWAGVAAGLRASLRREFGLPERDDGSDAAARTTALCTFVDDEGVSRLVGVCASVLESLVSPVWERHVHENVARALAELPVGRAHKDKAEVQNVKKKCDACFADLKTCDSLKIAESGARVSGARADGVAALSLKHGCIPQPETLDEKIIDDAVAVRRSNAVSPRRAAVPFVRVGADAAECELHVTAVAARDADVGGSAVAAAAGAARDAGGRGAALCVRMRVATREALCAAAGASARCSTLGPDAVGPADAADRMLHARKTSLLPFVYLHELRTPPLDSGAICAGVSRMLADLCSGDDDNVAQCVVIAVLHGADTDAVLRVAHERAPHLRGRVFVASVDDAAARTLGGGASRAALAAMELLCGHTLGCAGFFVVPRAVERADQLFPAALRVRPCTLQLAMFGVQQYLLQMVEHSTLAVVDQWRLTADRARLRTVIHKFLPDGTGAALRSPDTRDPLQLPAIGPLLDEYDVVDSLAILVSNSLNEEHVLRAARELAARNRATVADAFVAGVAAYLMLDKKDSTQPGASLLEVVRSRLASATALVRHVGAVSMHCGAPGARRARTFTRGVAAFRVGAGTPAPHDLGLVLVSTIRAQRDGDGGSDGADVSAWCARTASDSDEPARVITDMLARRHLQYVLLNRFRWVRHSDDAGAGAGAGAGGGAGGGRAGGRGAAGGRGGRGGGRA